MSKIVKKLLGGGEPKAPKVIQAPPPPPSVDTQAVQQAADTERRRLRAGKGRASTLLSGGKGVTDQAEIGTRTLLG